MSGISVASEHSAVRTPQAMRAWRVAQQSIRTLERVPKRDLSHSCVRQYGFSVADIIQHGGNAERVSVTGWVRSVRKQKRVAFAAVGDGSTIDSLQAVLKPEDAAEYVYCELTRIGILMKVQAISWRSCPTVRRLEILSWLKTEP